MEYVENPMTIGDYPYYQSQEDYEKEMRKQNLEEKIEYLKNEIEIEYDESLRDEYVGLLCLLQEELNYLDSLWKSMYEYWKWKENTKMNKIQKQYKINEKLTKLSAKKMFEELGFRQVLCINQNNSEHAQIKYEAVFANCIKREVR